MFSNYIKVYYLFGNLGFQIWKREEPQDEAE